MPINSNTPPVTPPQPPSPNGRNAFIAAQMAMNQQNDGVLNNVRTEYRTNNFRSEELGEDAQSRQDDFRAERAHENLMVIESAVSQLTQSRLELASQGRFDEAEEKSNEIDRLQSIDVNLDGFDMDFATKSFTKVFNGILDDFGTATRDEMKVSLSRMDALMDSLEASNAVEKDFLLAQYSAAQDVMQKEYNKRASVAARATETLAELGEQYLDVSSMYAGFVDNNPLAMGLFKIGADFVRRSRANKKAQREAREQDEFNISRETQLNEENIKRAEITRQREEEIFNQREETAEIESNFEQMDPIGAILGEGGDAPLTQDFMTDLFSGITDDDDVIRLPFEDITNNNDALTTDSQNFFSGIQDDDATSSEIITNNNGLVTNNNTELVRESDSESLTQGFMTELFSDIQDDDATSSEIITNNNNNNEIIRLPIDEFSETGDPPLTQNFMTELFSGIQDDDATSSEIITNNNELVTNNNDTELVRESDSESLTQNFMTELFSDIQDDDAEIITNNSNNQVNSEALTQSFITDSNDQSQQFMSEMFENSDDISRTNNRNVANQFTRNEVQQSFDRAVQNRQNRIENEYFTEDSVRSNRINETLLRMEDQPPAESGEDGKSSMLSFLGMGKMLAGLPRMITGVLVGGAALLGLGIGNWINDNLISDEAKIWIGDTIGGAIDAVAGIRDSETFIEIGDTIGNTVDGILSFFGSDEAQARQDAMNGIKADEPKLIDKIMTSTDNTRKTETFIAIGDSIGGAVDTLLSFFGSDEAQARKTAMKFEVPVSETTRLKTEAIDVKESVKIMQTPLPQAAPPMQKTVRSAPSNDFQMGGGRSARNDDSAIQRVTERHIALGMS